METLIAPTFNVALLVGILVYFLRQPVRDFISGRHVRVRDELEKVRAQLRESQSKYDEFSAKLKAIDAELGALREQARSDAERAKERRVADAKRLGEIIVTDAQAAAKAAYSDLREDLRTEFADHVLTKAEGLLRERLTGDDRVRIRREFSKLVETQVGQGGVQ